MMIKLSQYFTRIGPCYNLDKDNKKIVISKFESDVFG